MDDSAPTVVPPERIERCILFVRGHKVMLDSDLAVLYCVTTKALNQAVRRNRERFPGDFMFQLTWEETNFLRSQIVTLKTEVKDPLSGQTSAVSSRRGTHIKYRPCVFTEQGIAMLSSVLKSDRAILVNVEIMRAFVKMRAVIASHEELRRQLAALEQKYDAQFRVVFDAIRQIMKPPAKKTSPIGFGP